MWGSSYWIENFPSGTVRRGETPEVAARREMAEEIGLAGASRCSSRDTCGFWDARRDRVHFLELRLDRLPELQADNREIVAARLISPDELCGVALRAGHRLCRQDASARWPFRVTGQLTGSIELPEDRGRHIWIRRIDIMEELAITGTS
jgi:ADP-ribose pyrophosphatase YjhB (NUDIX family)